MKEAIINLAGGLFPNLFRKVLTLRLPVDQPADRYDSSTCQSPLGKHIQEFRNSTPSRLKISFEPYGQLYLLKPGDEMTIIYDQDPDCPGLGLSTFVYDDGLMVCAQEFDGVIVLINGNLVESL